MRITYVTQSFLDYRVPVFEELDRLSNGKLHVIYADEEVYVPKRVAGKISKVLGDRAIGLSGEKRIGPPVFQGFANRSLRLVYQPGVLKAIKTTKPDVLVGDGFYQWTSFALAYRMLHGTPLAVTYERTFHTERHAQWIRTTYRRLAMRFIDAMAVNGSLSKDYTEWLGMPRDRITTGQMAADTSGLAKYMETVLSSEKAILTEKWGNPDLTFLVVGRLIELKGLRELLRSWAEFEREVPGNWRLVLIGCGPLEDELICIVKDYGLKGVVFEGHVDYDKIALYYAAADVFLIPTLEDNWSLVVPEAMACGLPIISSKYNGCYPEMVEPDMNGWLFDPLDNVDTLSVLKRAVSNRSCLPGMGKRSLEIVSKHSPENAARAILNACQLASSQHS